MVHSKEKTDYQMIHIDQPQLLRRGVRLVGCNLTGYSVIVFKIGHVFCR